MKGVKFPVYWGETMPKGSGKPKSYLSRQHGLSVWHRFTRLMRYRLVIPILRARHEPEYTARGVFVGVAWGFTPTVGFQMPIVFVIWSIMRILAPLELQSGCWIGLGLDQ